MLVTLHDVLRDAKQKQYAVGLFNTVNLEMAKGVIAAAEEADSPVIIGTAEVLLPFSSLRELAPMLVPLAKKARVPVVLHFDHGLTPEKIVEGELGHVGANEGGAESTGAEDHSIYTEPADALRFVQETGVDALAVAIGTAHGAYKSTPKLDFDRLREIAELVDTPLVLHGGSGLSDEDFRRSVANGIAKINIFTDINQAAAKTAHDMFFEGAGMTDLMPHITEAIKQATLKKMAVFGSPGHGGIGGT